MKFTQVDYSKQRGELLKNRAAQLEAEWINNDIVRASVEGTEPEKQFIKNMEDIEAAHAIVLTELESLDIPVEVYNEVPTPVEPS